MKKIFKQTKVATILIAMLLSSCSYVDENSEFHNLLKPLFLRNLPKGNTPYNMGFRDGCYHFIGQISVGMLRVYNHPANPDPEYSGSSVYKEGYKQGGRYCSVYVNNLIIL